MVEKTIEFDGKEFVKMKTIKSSKHTYVEYRNKELRKIKFFEIDEGLLKEVSNKEDLKEAVLKSYIIKTKNND